MGAVPKVEIEEEKKEPEPSTPSEPNSLVEQPEIELNPAMIDLQLSHDPSKRIELSLSSKIN